MSVVLVCFPGAPKISEEAVKKEEELDKYLETRVEGQYSEMKEGGREVEGARERDLMIHLLASPHL